MVPADVAPERKHPERFQEFSFTCRPVTWSKLLGDPQCIREFVCMRSVRGLGVILALLFSETSRTNARGFHKLLFFISLGFALFVGNLRMGRARENVFFALAFRGENFHSLVFQRLLLFWGERLIRLL